MEPKVIIITPTGYRPEALRVCNHHVINQKYQGPIEWIVIDDSLDPKMIYEHKMTPRSAEVYPSPLPWKTGYNTQRFSLMRAFQVIEENYSDVDYIFFFEDDDFYSPNYIKEYVELLKNFEIVGEGNAKYYHLPSKTYSEMKNYEHCSLACTAFRKSFIPIFLEALHSGEKFFDITTWQLAKKYERNSMIFVNKQLSVGIKGFPGRPGIGVGHTPAGWTSDPFGGKLRQWCGKDAELYTEFLGKKQNG
jgi:hypothetical protein